jgi:pimeloyl-ACP methyl ester carboxylesterase
MLHGWGGQAASMTPLVVGLRDKYRVLALDLPGFGGSSPPPTPWGTPEYAAFVEKVVTSLGITRATYVGHSFGGRIAIWLAAHVPETVQALVLVDAAGIKPPATLRRRTRQIFYKVAKTVLRLPILGAQGPALQERLAMRFGSADYRAMTGVMRASMVKTVNLDLAACLKTVSAPTLLLWGEKDTETPIADGRKMERLISGSRLIAVAGAGHFSYLDNPAFVNAVVSAFLHGTREGAKE